MHTTAQVDTCRNISPLVATSNLQLTSVLLIEMHEIVRLQQHVTEFGVTQSCSIQAILDRLLTQHHINRRVLANIAQEFDVAELIHPIKVIN